MFQIWSPHDLRLRRGRNIDKGWRRIGEDAGQSIEDGDDCGAEGEDQESAGLDQKFSEETMAQPLEMVAQQLYGADEDADEVAQLLAADGEVAAAPADVALDDA